VSTLNNQDPEMQLTELREYAGRRGWQIVEEFTDQGVSGCKESRPALNRLMSDACRRRFDAVLVWKIDRFGRSLKHLVNALAELAALGVAFVSLRDNLDLSTPSGRLIFTRMSELHSQKLGVVELTTADSELSFEQVCASRKPTLILAGAIHRDGSQMAITDQLVSCKDQSGLLGDRHEVNPDGSGMGAVVDDIVRKTLAALPKGSHRRGCTRPEQPLPIRVESRFLQPSTARARTRRLA